jgi:gluconate 5-dehydrogenase
MSVKQDLDLKGRVALVTGGSRGLGLAIASALGEMGAAVALTARKADELLAAREHLGREGIDAFTSVSDLSRTETIPPMVEAVLAALGRIDILINNAGTTWGAPAEDHPLESWRKVIDVNLTGTWVVTQEVAARSMIPRRYGRIVNIASIAALRGSMPSNMRAAAYHASKGGLVSLTRALAGEWGQYGIVVNAVCPGFIPSKMSSGLLQTIGARVIETTPLGKLGTDEDVKGVTVLLASGAAGHITGQVIAVDGGASVV